MTTIRSVSSELAIKACNDLNESEKCIIDGISVLQEWISLQAHLKSRTDDQFLLAFLRDSKYCIEKAKQKLDLYYSIKGLTPEIFQNKQVDDKVMRLAKVGHFFPLPKPLKVDGPRLYITRFKDMDPSEFQLADLAKFHLRIYDIQMYEDDNTVISGIICITDFSSTSPLYMLQYDPGMFKKIEIFASKAIPIQVKSLHFINVPKEVAVVINLCRNMLSNKMSEKIFVHTSTKSLYEYVPKEFLPEDYGGTNGSIKDSVEFCEKLLLRYKDFFAQDELYGTNEKLRVGAKVTTESLFGLDGSFRKLDVD